MILVRWSWCSDYVVMILLWDNYLLELVWWPMILKQKWSTVSLRSHILNMDIGWAMRNSRSHVDMIDPSSFRGEIFFAVDHVDSVNWYEIMNLLVSYQRWNQQKIYLVNGREYGTNFAVLRSGLRYFDWFRLWST